jgi:SAM-dependent methyltransferase
VDHATTADLRQKYATDDFMADHLDEIVDVDVVWDGSTPLLEAIGTVGEATVDFVFASHVIEHAPDMIGWLRQIGQVLGDGGRLYLAIPDKRLCFDVNRDLTTMADLVDAHLRGLSAPGFRQIYDFHSRIIEVDAAALWAGTADYRGTWRADLDPDEWAYELCLKVQQTGEYVDGHCQVFTPTSFLDIYGRLVKLGLIDYRIATFHPSVWGTIEFRVVLEKLPDSMSADERRAAQLASIPTSIDDPVPAFTPAGTGSPSASASPEPLPDGVVTIDVSTREQSLIEAKRRAVEKARSLAGRLRSRGSTPGEDASIMRG